jgi:hypothetical protein
MMQYCPICDRYGCRPMEGFAHIASRIPPEVYVWLKREIPSLAKALTTVVIVLMLTGCPNATAPQPPAPPTITGDLQ